MAQGSSICRFGLPPTPDGSPRRRSCFVKLAVWRRWCSRRARCAHPERHRWRFGRLRRHGLDKLAAQISQTVQWGDCLQSCLEAGATAFLEFGPGHALSRHGREIEPGLPVGRWTISEAFRACATGLRGTSAPEMRDRCSELETARSGSTFGEAKKGPSLGEDGPECSHAREERGSSRDLGSQSPNMRSIADPAAKVFHEPRCFSFRMIHEGPPAARGTRLSVTEPGRIQRAWVKPMRSGWRIASAPACRL